MNRKIKILNLYPGIGGNRKLWGDSYDITAVENDPPTAKFYKTLFPGDTVIVGDAHKYLLDHYKEFDFVWGSTPCPTHSDIRRCGVQKGQCAAVYPDMTLYQEIILMKHFAPLKIKWVFENVRPYYIPLIPPTKKLGRHYFWANFPIGQFQSKHDFKIEKISGGQTVFGFNVSASKILDKRKALRNLVDPELGKYIFDCAFNIITAPKSEQIQLEI